MSIHLPDRSTWYAISAAGSFTEVKDCLPFQGSRFAIVLHGLGESRENVAQLGAWLASQIYDAVLIYEYDSISTGVETTAATFSGEFFKLFGCRAFPHVDAFSTSAGGIVLLSAIKYNGVGSLIDRVVTFSSIVGPLPTPVVDVIRALFSTIDPRMSTAPLLDDLTEGSQFSQRFAATLSPFRTRTRLYTFVGTRYYTFSPFLDQFPDPFNPGKAAHSVGEIMDNTFAAHYGGAVPNDGLITVESALSPTLETVSNFWATNPGARLSFNHDHSSLSGEIYTPTPANPGEITHALSGEVLIHLREIISDRKTDSLEIGPGGLWRVNRAALVGKAKALLDKKRGASLPEKSLPNSAKTVAPRK